MTNKMEVESDAQKLGRFFRHYRKAKRITLHEMSAALDISVNPIRAHEGGERLLRLQDIWRAAQIFGVTYDKLLDPNAEPEKSHGTSRSLQNGPRQKGRPINKPSRRRVCKPARV